MAPSEQAIRFYELRAAGLSGRTASLLVWGVPSYSLRDLLDRKWVADTYEAGLEAELSALPGFGKRAVAEIERLRASWPHELRVDASGCLEGREEARVSNAWSSQPKTT